MKRGQPLVGRGVNGVQCHSAIYEQMPEPYLDESNAPVPIGSLLGTGWLPLGYLRPADDVNLRFKQEYYGTWTTE